MIEFGIFAALIVLGFSSGTLLERRHFARLAQATGGLRSHGRHAAQVVPGGVSPELPAKMFAAESVIASDYFKSFLSGVRKFFGGELRSYLSLLERARAEAQVRILEQARDEGYDSVCNLRLVTVDIGGATNPKRQAVTVAILAVGTAYKRSSASASG